MPRYLNSKCKLCRREGTKLFLKGERCYSSSCPLEKKGAVPPGQQGFKSSRRLSDYGKQLREKQKLKRIYGIGERQLKNYFKKAMKIKQATSEALLGMLESRVDNIVYHLGFAPSRSVARQLVSHKHVLVDGKKIDIPSYQIKPGQTISLGTKALQMAQVKQSLAEKTKIPDWLKRKAAVGQMVCLPKLEELEGGINKQLIVEYYSR